MWSGYEEQNWDAVCGPVDLHAHAAHLAHDLREVRDALRGLHELRGLLAPGGLHVALHHGDLGLLPPLVMRHALQLYLRAGAAQLLVSVTVSMRRF